MQGFAEEVFFRQPLHHFAQFSNVFLAGQTCLGTNLYHVISTYTYLDIDIVI